MKKKLLIIGLLLMITVFLLFQKNESRISKCILGNIYQDGKILPCATTIEIDGTIRRNLFSCGQIYIGSLKIEGLDWSFLNGMEAKITC